MSTLITLENTSLAFGLDILLDNVKLQIATGERICLIGRNGAGKSSLLKIIEGQLQPDSGSIWRKNDLRVARLQQELPRHVTETVYEYVSQGIAEIGSLLAEYHALTQKLSGKHTEKDLQDLEQLQHQLDEKNGWQFDQRIQTILDRLELPADVSVSELSGGWQRRAAFAQALVSEPELLLLDEPTNHLDIAAIQWLEDQLLNTHSGILFITHDRALLKRLATRIIELDRGQLTSWPGDYDNFLRRKEEMLHAESKQNAEFDKKLAQEERWIRQGIKARRTRNEGRVRSLEAMRLKRSERRERQGKVSFDRNEAEQSGQLVIEANDITQQYQNKYVIKDFSIRITRGDKIGLIGPNGVGKSTLLNILLGQIQPQIGTVKLGTKLKVAYFDQLRAALDLEKNVIENVVQGSDYIEINGRKKHVIGYLSDFLFTPQRAMTPVKALSGGECNRLLLARLFSQAANFYVLDEPTNDLDIETLELLEELLMEFDGTLLLVSHDRAFLDNVVTSTLIFEGNGIIKEYIGGYADWLKHQTSQITSKKIPEKIVIPKNKNQKKLSYKDQKALEDLPKHIEKLEAEQSQLQQEISHPDFYRQETKKVAEVMTKIKDLSDKLEAAYQQWENLLKNSDQE